LFIFHAYYKVQRAVKWLCVSVCLL